MKSQYWHRVIPVRKYLSLSLGTVVLALALLLSGWLVNLNYLVYDHALRVVERPMSPEIAIVAIDERSLAQLGQWPWSRALHARIVERLSEAGAKAIALDLILAEPDRIDPAGDTELARALEASGRVVLPVVPEPTEIDGLLQETRPLDILARNAAALGHIDVELDPDGKVRRSYLWAGIGKPNRPNLALALLDVNRPSARKVNSVRGKRAGDSSSTAWVRDRMFLVPFASRTAFFSYVDVLSADKVELQRVFAGKFILVGATAAGLGERYATPAGEDARRAMPGVEILANVANVLLRGEEIVPLALSWQVALTLLLVAPVYLMYRAAGPRWALPVAIFQLTLVLAVSVALLYMARLWFPPMAAMLAIALSYPLWSWRRMHVMFSQLFQEKERAEVTLHSIGDGVVTTDSDGCIRYMNPSAEKLTGWDGCEAKGKPVESVLRLQDERGVAIGKLLLSSLRSENAVALFPEGTTIVSRDGSCFDIHGTAAPIHDHSGKVVGGVITMSDVSNLRQAAAMLSYQATHDSLTDLPNRSMLQDHLQRAISHAQRSGHNLGILFVDLDNFKGVNDGLGHAAGDRVLEAVAKRLQDCHRGEDLVARLGGDEFVVVLDHIDNTRQISVVARKICDALDRPVEIEGRSYFVTASIGIAVFPKDGETVEDLLKNADAAMYQAKGKGRGYIQFYSPEMNRQALTRLDLERRLRYVHKRGEMEIHYQPIFDLEQGSITAVEALLRWRHPEEGLLGPDAFLPIAEETGLISELGKYVIHTVCSQAMQWKKDGLPRLRMAVNLSPRQLTDPSLVESTRRILEDTGMDPADLEFEITESLLTSDLESVTDTLNALKSLGVRLAIDDFGTGYSSLSRLKHFPVDGLKIDKSFVHDIRTDTSNGVIASAVITLAHSMNLSVVAEGVESSAQLRHLRSKGCNEIQGYFLSRPLSAAAMTSLLAEGSDGRWPMAGIS